MKMTLFDRASRYLANMPPGISGSKGHDATFAAAVALVHGFALTPSEAAPLLADFNSRSSPPWSEKELAHKLEGSLPVFTGVDRGCGAVESARAVEAHVEPNIREIPEGAPPVMPRTRYYGRLRPTIVAQSESR